MTRSMPTAAVLAALLFASPALAQNTLVEVDDGAVVPTLNLTADQVEDMNVSGGGGTKIGEVDEVVGNDAKTPSALVVDFEDGSNYPDRDIAIPLDQFTLQNGMLMLATKPTDLGNYPEYKD